MGRFQRRIETGISNDTKNEVTVDWLNNWATHLLNNAEMNDPREFEGILDALYFIDKLLNERIFIKLAVGCFDSGDDGGYNKQQPKNGYDRQQQQTDQQEA